VPVHGKFVGFADSSDEERWRERIANMDDAELRRFMFHVSPLANAKLMAEREGREPHPLPAMQYRLATEEWRSRHPRPPAKAR
jgi:hypothetical protein